MVSERRGEAAAIIVTALAFALIHIPTYGVESVPLNIAPTSAPAEGVLVRDDGGPITLTVPTQLSETEWASILADELDPAGYSPLFVSGHWNAATEARCIDVLRSRRVDG